MLEGKKTGKPVVSLKTLLEAGVHFGHQTRRWNPKMKPYIFCVKDGVHIFDLAQTAVNLTTACDFAEALGERGGSLVFVGTKRQVEKIVAQEAQRCQAFYINKRWIGGFLTNFEQVFKNIQKLEKMREEAVGERTKKEKLLRERKREKLESLYGGLIGLKKLPDALFIVDAKNQRTAVREAERTGVKVIAVCDSNADPTGIDFVIPGNDDATKALKLYCKLIADSYLKGRQKYEKKEK